MITRCCLRASSRHVSALFSKLPSCHSIKDSLPLSMETLQSHLTDDLSNDFTNLRFPRCVQWPEMRHFSSARRNGKDDDDDDDDDDDEDEADDEDYDDAGENDESGESSSDEGVSGSVSGIKREYSEEEKESESAAIGYKVIGPLGRSERVFKSYEPVFAVVQVGSHQFKVSNGDCIFTERLKFCEVNDKIILNKVLLLGSSSQTIVGRPIVPDGMVHAIVEEHALDAKVIIFKKKRRKNYRRTKGHRQELTKLRIIDIQGIEKPEKTEPEAPLKNVVKKEEDIAAAAAAAASPQKKLLHPTIWILLEQR